MAGQNGDLISISQPILLLIIAPIHPHEAGRLFPDSSPSEKFHRVPGIEPRTSRLIDMLQKQSHLINMYNVC